MPTRTLSMWIIALGAALLTGCDSVVDPGGGDEEGVTFSYSGGAAGAFAATGVVATGQDGLPALEAFATSLGMVFMKVPPPDGAPADQYSVDHSSTLVVLDPQGRMAGLLRPPLQPDAIAADLLALSGSDA